MKRFTSLALIVAILLTSLFFGCSSDNSSSSAGSSSSSASSSSILDGQVLNYLPASTIGFITWDSQSDSYKRMKASAWGHQANKSYELLKKMEGEVANEPEAKSIMTIVSTLFDTGLISKDPSQPDVIRSAVAFFDVDSTKKLPSAGIYVTASEGNDLQSKLATIEGALTKEGLKTNKESLSGGNGFSIDLDAAKSQGAPIDKIFAIATKDKLAIGTSNEVITKFLSGPGDGGIQKIKDSNEFKQAMRGVNTPSDSLSLAYFDVNKLVAALQVFADGADTENLKEIPVESLVASSSMSDNLSSILSVSLSPKTDMQKKVISTLSVSGKNDIVKKVPSDMMLLLSLDGATISGIKNLVLADAPPGAADAFKTYLDLVDSIKTIAIGIRPPGGASPFPEAVLLAESSKASDIESNLKSQLDMMIAGSGMPMPLQQKKINEAQVTYAVSPFGVGGYLTTANGFVIVTTAEKLISEVINLSKDDTNGLLASLSKSSKEMVNNSKPLVVAHLDFTKIGNALGTAQDSLAMFTGGKTNIPPDQIETLKKMGTMVLSLGLENNLVKLQSNYELPPTKG